MNIGEPAPLPSESGKVSNRSAAGTTGVDAIPGTWYDISTRLAARTAYNNDYLPTANAAIGFTGNVAAGIPGDTSAAYKAAANARVNWFRAIAGVPASITFNSTFNQQAQQGALLIAANGQLNHVPPSTWLFAAAFPQGVEALALSNLCSRGATDLSLTVAPDPGCVEQYILDQGAGNEPTGHRRWILYPFTKQMGVGEVPVVGTISGRPATYQWNVLYINDGVAGPRPATRESFVAWPPKGYVPYQVTPPRWSFTYPGADFSAATVSMTENGSTISTAIDSRASFLDPGLVWVPNGLSTFAFQNPWPKPSADTKYTVTISNVKINNMPTTFTYDVTVFDPAVTPPGAGCDVSQTSISATQSLFSSQISVVNSGGCGAWTASADKPWIEMFPNSGTGAGTIHYSIYPNFSTQPRSATMTIAGRTVAITQQAATGTADERFVALAYFNYLGRMPSPAEVAFHVANSLGNGRAGFAASLFNAPEFNAAGRFTAGLYVGILNRNAEFAGWRFQRNTLAGNFTTPATLAGNFLLSPEFQQQHPNVSNDEFVRILYRQILLREPSPAEVAFQSGVLSDTQSRVNMATSFLNSAEFQIGTGPRLTAFLLYATLLNRDPSFTEFANAVAALSANPPVPAQTLVNNIVNGQEFLNSLQ